MIKNNYILFLKNNLEKNNCKLQYLFVGKKIYSV